MKFINVFFCFVFYNKLIFTQDKTVKELYQIVAKQQEFNADDLRLSYGGKPLDKDSLETLEDAGLEHNCNLVALVRVSGGSKHLQGRRIGRNIQVTDDEEDIITLDDENPTMKLPCGHAIAPVSLATFIKSEISQRKQEIKCPACFKEWKLSIIKDMGLTAQESHDMEVGLSKNYYLCGTTQSKECPWCGLYIEKKDSGIRVRCPMCKKDFCWDCLESWKAPGSGYRECGNPNCGKSLGFINILLSCPETTMKYSGLVVPDIRACIGCGEGINHKSGCKHMQCPICKTEFCFVCLKKWPCSRYDEKCEVAPRQATLPKK